MPAMSPVRIMLIFQMAGQMTPWSQTNVVPAVWFTSI